MMKQHNNDSLVYSQGGLEQQVNLLSDSNQWHQSILQTKKCVSRGFQTVKIQKAQKFSLQNNQSLTKYLKNDSTVDKEQFSMKSFRKLDKDKQKFLAYDQKIQKVALKPTTKAQKINELVTMIEAQKISQNEQRLKQFAVELLQIAEDVINQKKSLQKQIENIIDLNKLMTTKLRDVEKTLQQLKHHSKSCCCQKTFSFSKNKATPINYLDRFEFAKTIISSIQELQLKKIQEEQGITTAQLPLVELLLILKNKAEGASTKISQGLLDRIASGSTLKQWIKIIDDKLASTPNVSDFQQGLQKRENTFQVINQFIELLKSNQKNLIKNIKTSKDPCRQAIYIRNSATQTYLQILQNQLSSISKQQAIAYYGNINRCLILIQKQSEVQLNNQNNIFSLKEINNYIEQLFQ